MDSEEDEKSQRKKAHFIQFFAMLSGYISMLDVGTELWWTYHAENHLTGYKSEFPEPNADYPLLITIVQIFRIFGSIVASILLNRIGRKNTLLLFSFVQLISWILVNLSHDFTFLMVARTIVGFSSGGSYTVFIIYIGEVSGKEIRGTFLSLATISMMGGKFLINALAAFLPYKTMNLIMISIPITAICLSAFTLETPYYLLMQNRNEEATKTLMKLSGTKKREMVMGDIQRMKEAVFESQISDNSSIREVFSDRGSRRALISLIVAEMTCILSYHIIIHAFLQLIILYSVDSSLFGYIVMIKTGVQIFVGILSSQFSDRWGRRSVFLFSGLTTAFTLGTLGFFKTGVSEITWIPLVATALYVFIFKIGLVTIPCVYSGELFSLKVKGAAVTCYLITKVIIHFSMIMMLPYDDIEAFHKILWIIACLCVIGSIIVFRITPETKGKNLEEVVELMRGKRKRVHANDLLVVG